MHCPQVLTCKSNEEESTCKNLCIKNFPKPEPHKSIDCLVRGPLTKLFFIEEIQLLKRIEQTSHSPQNVKIHENGKLENELPNSLLPMQPSQSSHICFARFPSPHPFSQCDNNVTWRNMTKDRPKFVVQHTGE